MKEFYSDYTGWIMKILEFEEDKLINPDEHYAWKVRNKYASDYVKKGLVLAKELQKKEKIFV